MKHVENMEFMEVNDVQATAWRRRPTTSAGGGAAGTDESGRGTSITLQSRW
jgi:hypothetical protein